MASLLAASEAQGAGKLATILYSFLILPSVFLEWKILRDTEELEEFTKLHMRSYFVN